MLHLSRISLCEKQKEIPYVISTVSKIAPMPMLMFSAVMYLVCASGLGEAQKTEKSETHIFDKADQGKDRKSGSLPERQEN